MVNKNERGCFDKGVSFEDIQNMNPTFEKILTDFCEAGLDIAMVTIDPDLAREAVIRILRGTFLMGMDMALDHEGLAADIRNSLKEDENFPYPPLEQALVDIFEIGY